MTFCLFLIACSTQRGEEDTYHSARQLMVNKDIRGRGIDDTKVLDAMRRVKRHLFVPEPYRPMAYADRPLPIGEGQTISQPYIVALMTYHLHLKPGDKVLEIGTGSGYQAAVLAELAKEVYSIEIIEVLAHAAQERLRELGYTNVWVKSGDGFYGWKEHAPYDAIIITCATPSIPDHLVKQLTEGGRMILPLGEEPFGPEDGSLAKRATGQRVTGQGATSGFGFGHQSLTMLTKRGGKIEKQQITNVVFVPMTGEIEEKK